MKAKYTVLSPVNHDNELYTEGETIELEDKAAAPLLAAGDIAPAEKKAASPKGEAK